MGVMVAESQILRGQYLEGSEAGVHPLMLGRSRGGPVRKLVAAGGGLALGRGGRYYSSKAPGESLTTEQSADCPSHTLSTALSTGGLLLALSLSSLVQV